MSRWDRFQELMSPEGIAKQTRLVIEETLTCDHSLDNGLMMTEMTIGQFKQLKGFHGSRKMLKLLTSVWIGRLTRAFVLQNPWDADRATQLLLNSEEDERKAVDKLYAYFKNRFGEVDQETVDKLELMAAQMEVNNVEALKTLLEGRNVA